MSCAGVVFCLIVLAGTTLAYTGLATHPARMGSDTAIPCMFDVDTIPSAQRTFTVTWLFQGKEIFRYPLVLTSSDPRLSIDPNRVKDGIANLFLSAVTISDGGLYKCFMVHTSGRMEKEIRLDIQASPKISITNRTVAINQESVLRSTISGFYPVDIGVKWFREEKTLDNVIVERPQRLPDGTYIVNSSVTVTPTEEDRGRTFSCRVQHESITYALQEDFHLETDGEDVSRNIIIIAGAAVLFIAILIAVLIIIICKRKSPKRNKDEENLSNEKEPLNKISGGVHPEERASQQDSHNNYGEDTTPPNKQNNRSGGRIGEGNTPLTIGTKPAASGKYKARSYGEDPPKDMKSKEDSHNTDKIENKEIKEVGKHGEDSNKASNVTRSTSIARSVRSPETQPGNPKPPTYSHYKMVPTKQDNKPGGNLNRSLSNNVKSKPKFPEGAMNDASEDTPKDMKSKENSHNTDEIENKEIKEVGKHGEDSNKASNVTRSTAISASNTRSVRSPETQPGNTKPLTYSHTGGSLNRSLSNNVKSKSTFPEGAMNDSRDKITDESLEYTSETRRDKKGLHRKNSDHMAQDNKVDVKSRVKMFTDLEKSAKENGGFQNPAAGKSLQIPGQQYWRKPPPPGS
ncbi:uncharacterized protein [Hyperolius riggenbachi]|uniref:uncharacterized protein n=1 Tax=Hyperolius riggenbachi TaxID=752182 RepID=UPI0035A2C01F